ncbi:MAG: flavodoxin [Firmicutes bacterium HGW-Firmicutes-16]|nr:MAG: flavodoxin [Firmicutes bacterium HGW-Firmicutes-16]
MIVYFSGTGNSRYVAEALAIRLGEKLVNAKEYIKEHRTAELSSENSYIFVAPTYSWRIPRIFSDFIEIGKFGGSSSAYFVMTCGDDIGSAGVYLNELCTRKGFTYKGVMAVVMPENYVALFNVTEKAEAEQMISAADRRIKQISGFISSGNDFPAEKLSFLASLKSRTINPIFYKHFVKSKGFRVTDKCISCGRCEELCPLNNIRLVDGMPVYGENCTHCMACICGCPTEAIEYKKRTVGKLRYYNSKSPVIDD